MLFTSASFLFCFLPLLLVAVKVVSLSGPGPTALVLLLFSAVFYASWDVTSLCLLFCLIGMNYAFAQGLTPNEEVSPAFRRRLLAAALIINLLPLLWFKYSGFFVANLEFMLGTPMDFTPPTLPPGISFYTFIQIAWLVTVYRGQIVPEGLSRHAVFSSLFPCILSGPIVRYEQLGPQLLNLRGPNPENLALGFSLFSVGLAKKVLLADTLAVSANAVFSAAEKAWPLTGAEAWLGSLAYSFQLYFDFSGYTDMAIGIGLMLGLMLPENFISPYKATGIVDFWRRWHITLGLWLRDFLYIPLGGNRRGRLIQYRNLFLTMLIGGAWHGAGWTFIIWGALHGAMLCVNHFFRAVTRDSAIGPLLTSLPVRIFSIALTFFCLNACWVVFRAQSLEGALNMYSALFTGPFAATGAEGTLIGYLPHHYFQDWLSFFVLGLSAVIIWAFPCSHELFNLRPDVPGTWLRFSFSRPWAVGLALLTFSVLLFLSRKTAFLYFQF